MQHAWEFRKKSNLKTAILFFANCSSEHSKKACRVSKPLFSPSSPWHEVLRKKNNTNKTISKEYNPFLIYKTWVFLTWGMVRALEIILTSVCELVCAFSFMRHFWRETCKGPLSVRTQKNRLMRVLLLDTWRSERCKGSWDFPLMLCGPQYLA